MYSAMFISVLFFGCHALNRWSQRHWGCLTFFCTATNILLLILLLTLWHEFFPRFVSYKGLLLLWRENCFLQNKCNFFDSSNKSADTAADILREFKSKTTKEIPDFWLISPATHFLIESSLEADLDTRSCIDWRGKWTSSRKKKLECCWKQSSTKKPYPSI